MERTELAEQVLASLDFPQRKPGDEPRPQEPEDRLEARQCGVSATKGCFYFLT
ncbi:MAG: hypothetical protein JRJ12_12290 [Deltaproteobacteria bacterium]|nr:hypothetical protein [Deltaproteobacteria bacterium]MBW2069999.1 hypothetical protein [Deltaproteobacteria bacterium]